MKDLSISKVYDLSDLNKKQRETLYDWLLKNDNDWEAVTKEEFVEIDYDFLIYDGVEWDWRQEFLIDKKQIIANALELFEEEEDNSSMSVSWPNIEIKYETSGN